MIDSINDISSTADSIDDLIQNCSDHSSIVSVRKKILLLLEEAIIFYESNGLSSQWTKEHLFYAISYIAWNIEKTNIDTFMLSACLASIKKSATNKEEISASYYSRDNLEEIDKITSQDLISRVFKLEKSNELTS